MATKKTTFEALPVGSIIRSKRLYDEQEPGERELALDAGTYVLVRSDADGDVELIEYDEKTGKFGTWWNANSHPLTYTKGRRNTYQALGAIGEDSLAALRKGKRPAPSRKRAPAGLSKAAAARLRKQLGDYEDDMGHDDAITVMRQEYKDFATPLVGSQDMEAEGVPGAVVGQRRADVLAWIKEHNPHGPIRKGKAADKWTQRGVTDSMGFEWWILDGPGNVRVTGLPATIFPGGSKSPARWTVFEGDDYERTFTSLAAAKTHAEKRRRAVTKTKKAKKPRTLEAAKWEAIGVLSGGKYKQLVGGGFRVRYGKPTSHGSAVREDAAGLLSLGKLRALEERGLTVERVRPKGAKKKPARRTAPRLRSIFTESQIEGMYATAASRQKARVPTLASVMYVAQERGLDVGAPGLYRDSERAAFEADLATLGLELQGQRAAEEKPLPRERLFDAKNPAELFDLLVAHLGRPPTGVELRTWTNTVLGPWDIPKSVLKKTAKTTTAKKKKTVKKKTSKKKAASKRRFLGPLLAKHREKANVTRPELAKAMGLTVSTLTQIERGEIRCPPVARLEGAAKVLRIKLGILKRANDCDYDAKKKQRPAKRSVAAAKESARLTAALKGI